MKWPLELKWRRGKDLPFGVRRAHTVVLDEKLYIGGGFAKDGNDQYVVIQYDLPTETCSLLPNNTSMWFSMASVNGQLLLAGGSSNSQGIQVWNPDDCCWVPSSYPNMLDSKMHFAAVGYRNYVIFLCGFYHKNTVEILNCSTNQWYRAQPVPVGGHYMTSAVTNECVHISASDWNDHQSHVFSAHLPSLISNAETPNQTSTTPLWQELPTPPDGGPTLLALSNHLLVVGGKGYSRNLYCYDPKNKTWNKCGELPVGLWASSCAVLPSGELFVAGGEKAGSAGGSQEVWIGKIA